MSLTRRSFISLGLGGLAVAAGCRYLPSWAGENSTDNASTDSSAEGEVLLKFMAVGDVGTGAQGQYAVAEAMAQRWQSFPFPLALLTGDNIYENGEIDRVNEVFERPYANLLQNGVEFYAVLGNHDFRTNQGDNEVSYPGYNMPSRYYTFVKGSVQFFALDTNQAYSHARHRETPWDAQLRWLKTELKRSSAPWKVVFAHHPIYSSGWHGSDRDLARDLSPLFAEYGVQLYINGHDHNYERTRLINGTTYITSGNGAKLRRVGRSRWTAYSSSQLGFTAFDVYADRVVISAIDTNNNVYDEAYIMAV